MRRFLVPGCLVASAVLAALASCSKDSPHDTGDAGAGGDAGAASDAAPDAGTAVPTDGSGVQAFRIADLMERFGANVFSDEQDGASGETVAGLTAVTQYLTGSSGMTMMFRAYVSNASDYASFGPEVFAATGGKFTLAMGIGNTPDPSGVIALATGSGGTSWVQFVEGGNEPNTNFGSAYQTGVTPANELAAVQQIDAAVAPTGIPVATASVVGDASSISAYWGSDLAGAVAASDLYNTHLYPNNGGPNGANQLHDWSAAVQAIWGDKPGIITEWQPTVYNNVAQDDANGAYYTPIMLLSAFADFDVRGVFWWALFDYAGFSPHCGLFNDNAANPYPAAMAIRAMYTLTGDTGAAKHSFTPGKLDYTITGLPAGANAYAGGRSALFQNSSGTYFLFIWNEQPQLATTTTSAVTVTFNAGAMPEVVDYSLTNPTAASPAPKQTLTNVTTVDLDLTTEVRLLQITHR